MIRNCGELGTNLRKIIDRLLKNDKLVRLLYYVNDDPFNANLKEHEKSENQSKIFGELIKIIPRVDKETAHSVVVVYIQRGSRLGSNSEFRNIRITVDVLVPMTQWIINDTNLRPFAILGEIQASLDGKTVNGLGKMSGGDFELNFLTDDVACYQQIFEITEYA